MKRIYVAMSLVMASSFIVPEPAHSLQHNLPEVEINFDKVINFDELEEEMVKMNVMDSIKPIPPHPVIVWIRIIGCPLANSYFAVRRAIRNSIEKITAFFKFKSLAHAHEEKPRI